MSKPPATNQPAKGDRVAKRIARAGLASRREAERWIAAGRIAINGTTMTSPGIVVEAEDIITVDGMPLPRPERSRLFLYHKPKGLVTTARDPQGRATVFEQLPGDLPRLISVGRLDINTEGLLLLTNDGGLARQLELPATGWLRRYRARVHGAVDQDRLARLGQGMTIEGIRYGPLKAMFERGKGTNAWITLGLREGKNREVKKLLGALGLEVARLIRISFGPFQLGGLAAGSLSEVSAKIIREQLGERVIEAAGVDLGAPAHRPGRTLKQPTTPSGTKTSKPPRKPRKVGKNADRRR